MTRPATRAGATHFGWLVGERVLRLLLGAVVGFLVARHLGPERLGVLSYCVAFVSLLGFFPTLGLDGPLKRDVLRSPERTVELLTTGLGLRLAAGLIAWGAVALLAAAGWGFTVEERRLLLILALTLFQPALLVSDLWLQTQLRGRATALAQLGALLAAAALRLALIVGDAPLAAFAWAVVVETAIAGVGLFWAALRAGLVLRWRAPDVAVARRLLTESWPLMFASLAILVYMKIDEIMLRHLAGAEAVGTYAAAARLSELWYFVPTALASSVLPGLLRARERDAAAYARGMQQYYDLSAALAYGFAAPMAFAAPWLVRWFYGPEFAAAAPILAVHIWSGLFVFLGVARGQWLVNEGLSRFYLMATVAGAVVNVALNCWFIPRWGGLGAAWATVLAYGLAAWAASFCHPAVRATGWMQTRALLIPLRGWTYFRRA